jgi:hypothetical protein
MKYLKKYESYYSDKYQEMVDDIKDICIELEDEGMTINYYRTPSENVFSLIVSNGYDFSVEERGTLTNEEGFNNVKSSFDRIRECGKVHGWGNVTFEKIPASKGSITSKVPAGGYMIKLSRERVGSEPDRLYSESISNEDRDTIEDIVLELRDEGLHVDVSGDIQYHKSDRNSTNTTEHKGVAVYIEASEETDGGYTPFSVNGVIKDCLIRLDKYAKSIGCGMHIDPQADAMEFISLKDFIDIYSGDELVRIDVIIYEKERIVGIYPARNESKRQDYIDDQRRRQMGVTDIKSDSQLYWKIEDYEAEVFPIVDMVRDILVELSDENWDDPSNRFKVKVEAIGPLKHKKDKLGISITIHRASGFIRSDVYPSLERVTSYLTSEGYRKLADDIFDGYNCNIIYRWVMR